MHSDLTLLLLTHNRPVFLERSLDYYNGLPAKIVVLDSSEQSSVALASSYHGFEYLHCPEFGYQGISQKIKMGVERVDTPYMALVADDDFMLHDALAESLEFLKTNPDYSLCHGYTLMYLAAADKVHYFLRDRKVLEDFSDVDPALRLLDFMANYVPPAYAVTRTDLMKAWYKKSLAEYGMEYQEFGHAFHLALGGKARILPRPYIVRELNYPVSDHGTDLYSALHWETGEQGLQKKRFMDFLRERLSEAGCSGAAAVEVVEQAFLQLAACLVSKRSLTLKEIFHSEWHIYAEQPEWKFEPEQFVEMPFYNRYFFEQLAVLDLLMRIKPAGKLQLMELAEVLCDQAAFADSVVARQDQAGFWQEAEEVFKKNPFNLVTARIVADAPTGVSGAHRDWLLLLENGTHVHERLKAVSEYTVQPTRTWITPPDVLGAWLKERLPTEIQSDLIRERFSDFSGGPCIGVFVVDLHGDDNKLMATLRSLSSNSSVYTNTKIIVLTGREAPVTDSTGKLHFVRVGEDEYIQSINSLASRVQFDWLMMVRAGSEFTPGGLLMVALEVMEGEGCKAVYGDELYRLVGGKLGGGFKPGFNLDMLLSLPRVMAVHWLVRRDVFVELGGLDSDCLDAAEFDFLLRLIEREGGSGLGHVDEPILITDAPVLMDSPDEQRALLGHLQRRGYTSAELRSNFPGRYRINYGHLDRPLVSIIVPTKDQLPILQRCVESVLEKTAYNNYELLIVDNNSETPEALDWFAGVEGLGDSKVRILRYPHPFNYSAINNMAAREARGEYLVLLNNDTAIINEHWLDELLNHALRPEVGIVGAKLLYPDGKIQHAGVVLGLRGPADHPFIGEAMDAPGYMQRLQVDQNYSAVTAACLMIRKSIYAAVGGLDEERFKVSYNDVDLCLKVREAGHLIVWAPHAVVMHEGSVSQKRIDPQAAEAKRKRFIGEQDAMYEKWLPVLASDPAYNRNLSLNSNGFELEADVSLTWRPLNWRPLPVVLAHPADLWGCGHYRVIQPFSALKREGLVDGMMSEGLLQVVDLQRYDPDVIVLQRQIGDARLEAMRRIKQFSRAFKVYELDDYLPNLPMKSIHRDHMPKDVLRSLRRGFSFVDRFVVSTAPLAEAFAGMHPDIRVIENRLPGEWWNGLESIRRRGRKPRVGWAGGVSHTGDLELIADVVRELANEVEWVFFGMCPEKIRPYVHEIHTGVAIDMYPQALARLDLDLALAPVEQNLFNECKSNLRLLEYGACGFPVICSDVLCYQGDNLPVTRVKNRFRDWVDAIRMHLSDLDETARQGDLLREAVKRDWMLEGDSLLHWRNAWLPD